jgi:hypothetical protein
LQLSKSIMPPRAVGLQRPRPAAPAQRLPLAADSDSDNQDGRNAENPRGEMEVQRGARGAANQDEAERIANLQNDPDGAGGSPPPARAARAPVRVGRARSTWRNNHPKLNIMARTLLLMPAVLESSALHSNDDVFISTVNSHKRSRNQDFGWDNIKHAGKTYLMQKACEELNDDHAFMQLSDGQRIEAYLLAQKFNEFTLDFADDNPDNYVGPNLQQWKLDLREIHALQGANQQAIDAERNAGD